MGRGIYKLDELQASVLKLSGTDSKYLDRIEEDVVNIILRSVGEEMKVLRGPVLQAASVKVK